MIKDVTPTPGPSGASGADLGEDMLQMALRMATEMSEEPAMDLENSLEPVAVNTGTTVCVLEIWVKAFCWQLWENAILGLGFV